MAEILDINFRRFDKLIFNEWFEFEDELYRKKTSTAAQGINNSHLIEFSHKQKVEPVTLEIIAIVKDSNFFD